VFASSTADPGGPLSFEPGGAGLVPSVNGIFNDGRSAAWAGATPAGCPYGDPFLARACGWRAGQAEQRARHG
jgi:hypothetical protein